MRKRFGYVIISIIILTAIGLVTLVLRSGGRQELAGEYNIVFLGDSLFGQVRDETSVPSFLEEQLGCSVYNGCFGGTDAARIDSDRGLSPRKGLLSLEALSIAMTTGEFGAQRTLRIREYGTEHFAQTVEELSCIDFDRTDILVLEYGTNDYFDGVPLYNEENPEDKYSFYGALKTSVERIQNRYPEMRILLVSPTYHWVLAQGQTCEEWTKGEGFLRDYVEIEKRVAQETGIEFLDIYHDFYPHGEWEDWQTYTLDGVHPNEDGRRMIVGRIAEYLQQKRL